MFRKPRDQAVDANLGRPPSPQGPGRTPFTLAVPPSLPPPSRMGGTKTKPSKAEPLPTIGRQGPTGSAKKTAASVKGKEKGNGNIMSFFQKAEQDAGLFMQEKRIFGSPSVVQSREASPEITEDDRFNESGGSVKRRRLSADDSGVALSDHDTDSPSKTAGSTRQGSTPAQRTGPFMEESDSEDETDEQPQAIIPIKQEPDEDEPPVDALAEEAAVAPPAEPGQLVALEGPPVAEGKGKVPDRPSLIKDETSYGPGLDDFQDFEGIEEDFDEDLFEDGDEFLEQKYMREQARLEELNDEQDVDPLPPDNDAPVKQESDTEMAEPAPTDGPACPICSISLSGVNEQDAGLHVNNCLDGNPTPLPEIKKPTPCTKPSSPAIETENTASAAQYRPRPVRDPRPGQANPFTFGQPNGTNGGSAFGKLMSGHSEEAAWAEAAATEHASRGKPSYQRTCPFYKIMPGLFICVDAFRYGAVSGCQAYFLSHFHSDHYVGLTSSWRHGPIYCSHVTANLVRQQLRVDPKYVVDLEFDQTVEVPGSKGVKVTMIPANHCPGSSLYLFEKTVGKQKNGEPRLQRILHCGDFRACRAHVEHPLLMPDIQDKLTGKTKEQKIDVCYLDTTYLNPKYAFPSQQDVIKACADMCVSLARQTPDQNDEWEQMKRQRAGGSMVNFVKRENSKSEVKEEPTEDEQAAMDNMQVETNPHPDASQRILSTSGEQKQRGRLLVVVGTYSIGKERICLGIARALDAKIYAPSGKQKIVAALEDPELDARMTNDPRQAQIHMTPLFEIRAETLDDYLKDYWPHFTRAVGFRPSGWNYRPPGSRVDNPTVSTVLYSSNWKSGFAMSDLVPQRGSTGRASCFGVPYSEHSSFRELTMFCSALRIERVIPTVNVGSAKSRERMKAWCERWAAERRKNGLYLLPEDGSW